MVMSDDQHDAILRQYLATATAGTSEGRPRSSRTACPGCGHDVRGVAGTNCPECGVRLRLALVVDGDHIRMPRNWMVAVVMAAIATGAGLIPLIYGIWGYVRYQSALYLSVKETVIFSLGCLVGGPVLVMLLTWRRNFCRQGEENQRMLAAVATTVVTLAMFAQLVAWLAS